MRKLTTKLNSNKRHKLSSSCWLRRQLNDMYVLQSKIDGYRSRAAYKLIEINEKFQIIKPGNRIIDLGSAPGSWSQVAAKFANTKIIAIDLLPMDKIPNVLFIQKNFLDEDISSIIDNALQGNAVDIVMSDMAANTTGHGVTDNIRTLHLCEHALQFALNVLKPDGHFIAKIFNGGIERELLNIVKQNFKKIKHFKPAASRKESREYYLIALYRK